ncbi:hypothetical protein KY285_035952 [Solanum tuberosum]|nr:hypothetical protein KY289_036108 [Solanum tuberosum]KAH0639366.1 hypothetical protein KY285_035952 [Solanum tuberosum]
MNDLLPPDVVENVRLYMVHVRQSNQVDKPWWLQTCSLCTANVPVIAGMANWNPNISQLCTCCSDPARETIEHLFLQGELASSVWRYYTRAAGIIGPLIQVKQTLKKWWDTHGNERLKEVYQAILIPILWVLWKRRNTVLREGSYSRGKIISEINCHIHKSVKLSFNWVMNSPQTWPQFTQLDNYRPSFRQQLSDGLLLLLDG